MNQIYNNNNNSKINEDSHLNESINDPQENGSIIKE